jgi:hypothetical protein
LIWFRTSFRLDSSKGKNSAMRVGISFFQKGKIESGGLNGSLTVTNSRD